MWPRRKIQLVASSAAPGIDGVRAVLKGFQLEFFEGDPATEELSEEFTGSWWEKPIDFTSPATSAYEESSPVTELVFWPEVSENNLWRQKALARGLTQQSVQAFVHKILEEELVIRISEPTVLIQGRPLLGYVLNEAGFEPSLLWQTKDGHWRCERKQGLHWLLPESWLVGIIEDQPLGRGTEWTSEKATWVVRETTVDFYLARGTFKYIGQMPRWPEPLEEQEAYQTIAKCLELGVSWLDIKLALGSIWDDTILTDNLRWNIDDFRGNVGAFGEKLSLTSVDNVEDWWAR